MRLPWSRPCMSVRHSSTVSIAPVVDLCAQLVERHAREGIRQRTIDRNGRRASRVARQHTDAAAARGHRGSPGHGSALCATGPAPLGGGHHQPQLPRALRRHRRASLRIAGRQTELLGIDRAAERVATEAAAALGVAPEVLAFLPDARAAW